MIDYTPKLVMMLSVNYSLRELGDYLNNRLSYECRKTREGLIEARNNGNSVIIKSITKNSSGIEFQGRLEDMLKIIDLANNGVIKDTSKNLGKKVFK